MPRENYTIGDGALDYIGRCFSNDGVTPIEAISVGGVLQITHEASIQRQGAIISLPLATAAITHNKPPGALVGQTSVVLLEADIDVPLLGDDDLYIYSTFVTAEGPKVFLMIFDITDLAVEKTVEVKVLNTSIAVGNLSPVLSYLVVENGDSGSSINFRAEAVAYVIGSGPDAGVYETVGNEVYEAGTSSTVAGVISRTPDSAIEADDGTILSGNAGDSVVFSVWDGRVGSIQGGGVVKRVSIPFEAPIVGAPFVLG